MTETAWRNEKRSEDPMSKKNLCENLHSVGYHLDALMKELPRTRILSLLRIMEYLAIPRHRMLES